MKNHVFPFILPSHTSIWSQPNDCGTNKSLHHCFASARRASGKFNDETSVSYFNRIFEAGWRIFVSKEHEELTVNRETNKEKAPVFSNATTRSFKRTGIYPLNVHASTWKEAEETIGLACEIGNEGSVGGKNTWEVRVKKESAGTLTQEEENFLKKYLPSDGEERHILVHGKVVMDSILKRWRLQVKELEKEGNWKEAFQLQPKGISPHEVIAEKLFDFERPDVDSIPKAKEEDKEKIEKKYATSIVLACGSGRTGTLKIFYIERDDDSKLTRVEGNAMRRQDDKWYIGLDDGRSILDWGYAGSMIPIISPPNRNIVVHKLMGNAINVVVLAETKVLAAHDGNLFKRMTLLEGNPLVTTLPSQFQDPVLRDIQDIPRVCQAIQEDWQKPNLNRQTAWYLGHCIRERMTDIANGSISRNAGSVDIILTGCEVSLWIAENFASDLQKAFPKLFVKAVSSNKIVSTLNYVFYD
jgi:hypothetical protein